MIRSSWPWKSSWRSSASTASVLVGGQRLVGQPAAALDPEQVGGRAARDQVAVQDRLHLVLQPGALADDVRAAGDLAAQRLRVLVGHPHRRQVVRGQQLAEHRGVDLVGLDLRLGDRPGLHRVRHHHPRHPRLDQAHDRVRVARRLDRDLVRRAAGCRRTPAAPPAVSAICPACGPARPPTPRSARTRDAHPVRYTCVPSLTSQRLGLTIMGARRANDTYGFALAAHPGKSQGRPSTNTGSRRNV